MLLKGQHTILNDEGLSLSVSLIDFYKDAIFIKINLHLLLSYAEGGSGVER